MSDPEQSLADGILQRLRQAFSFFCELTAEHLLAAQKMVDATGAKDHASLRFLDLAADATWNQTAAFYARVRDLTRLVAAAENVEI